MEFEEKMKNPGRPVLAVYDSGLVHVEGSGEKILDAFARIVASMRDTLDNAGISEEGRTRLIAMAFASGMVMVKPLDSKMVVWEPGGGDSDAGHE